MIKGVTTGEYHSKKTIVDNVKDYKNYGSYDSSDEDIISNHIDLNIGFTTKEICEIWDKCGSHKYTYDINYDLQDFCKKDWSLCRVKGSCF